jgi:hypothetical protein
MAARTSGRTPAAFSLDGGNHSRGEPCPSRTTPSRAPSGLVVRRPLSHYGSERWSGYLKCCTTAMAISPSREMIANARPYLERSSTTLCLLEAGWAIRRTDRAAGVRSDEMVVLAPLRSRGTREAGRVGCRHRLRRWLPHGGRLRRPPDRSLLRVHRLRPICGYRCALCTS